MLISNLKMWIERTQKKIFVKNLRYEETFWDRTLGELAPRNLCAPILYQSYVNIK